MPKRNGQFSWHGVFRSASDRIPWFGLIIWTLIAVVAWTYSPTVAQEQTVEVSALWVLKTPTSASGEVRPVRITVRELGTTPFRISFVETEVGGSGSDWRSAGWMASVVAAQVLRFDPRSTNVAFEVAGAVDGPSPGGLLAAGIIAAVLGDSIRTDAAMTGTINPDGTIGPVGGIPQKIQGAANAGKKIVLIPAGIRIDTDLATQQEVDLFQLGKSLGVQVRPVFDIYSAYYELTGSKLARQVTAEHPRLDSKFDEQLLGKTREWLTRFETVAKQYENLPAAAHYEYAQERMEEAKSLISRGRLLLKEGETSAAFWDFVMANANASFALEAGRTEEIFQAHGWDHAVAHVRDTLGVAGQLDIVAERFRRVVPKTLDQAGMYLMAYSALLEAFSYHLLAEDLLANLRPNEDGYDDNLWQACVHEQVALMDLELAKMNMDLAIDMGGPPIPVDAPLQRLADFYRQAGDANLQVFESGFIEQMARNFGIRPEEARRRLADKDEFYGSTKVARNVAIGLEKYLGAGPQLLYVRLSAGLDQYVRSAALWAKYYSLGVTLDEDFAIIGNTREKSLQNALDWAEDEARRSIQNLRQLNADATACIQTYEIARMMRERDLPDKFDALSWFWSAHVTARVLAHLCGLEQP